MASLRNRDKRAIGCRFLRKGKMDSETHCPVLAIRADASVAGGIGHIARSLALADAWQDAGGKAILVSSGPRSVLEALAGVDFRWLGAQRPSLADDISAFLDIAHETGTNAVVLDSYDLDHTWEARVRGEGVALLAMDDLASRDHECDILLDTSIGPQDADRYQGLVPSEAVLLLGPHYAPLRRSFRTTRFEPRGGGPVRRVLISFGGTDPPDHTNAALDALALLNKEDLRVDVVASSANPRIRTLCTRVGALPQGFLHVDTNDMANLMSAADLALGAGGSSSWERCRAGLPSLVMLAAPNQRGIAAYLEAEGVARIVGGEGIGLVEELANALRAALTDGQWRAFASCGGMRIVDGLGAERVVARLHRMSSPTLGLELRPATEEDVRLLWQWRNDPETRLRSRNSDEIPWDIHLVWFAKRLADPDTLMLVGLRASRPIGVVRFDREADGHAEVSITLAPECRGRGLARNLLQRGCEYIVHTRFAQVLDAAVKADNTVSQRLFEGCGFHLVAGDCNWTRYRRVVAGVNETFM
jgi:UDP-2,4-diacetamido-2,4,6-trideoxy-beta-L-altropyranose hydrolase